MPASIATLPEVDWANAHTTAETDRTTANVNRHTDASLEGYFGAPAPEGQTAKAELQEAGKYLPSPWRA